MKIEFTEKELAIAASIYLEETITEDDIRAGVVSEKILHDAIMEAEKEH